MPAVASTARLLRLTMLSDESDDQSMVYNAMLG